MQGQHFGQDRIVINDEDIGFQHGVNGGFTMIVSIYAVYFETLYLNGSHYGDLNTDRPLLRSERMVATW
jgi:hypothetical protein